MPRPRIPRVHPSYPRSATAGLGRDEPNRNPVLPPPVGRIDLTQLWNPMYILRTCCGKKMFTEICCCLCLIVVVAGASYIVPPIAGIADVLGAFIGKTTAYMILLLPICCGCCGFCWLANRCSKVFCGADEPNDDDDDDDDDDDKE